MSEEKDSKEESEDDSKATSVKKTCCGILESCSLRLPGDWSSVEVTKIFAFFILIIILSLISFGDLRMTEPLVREVIATCLLVLFGSKYLEMRKGRKEQKKEDSEE